MNKAKMRVMGMMCLLRVMKKAVLVAMRKVGKMIKTSRLGWSLTKTHQVLLQLGRLDPPSKLSNLMTTVTKCLHWSQLTPTTQTLIDLWPQIMRKLKFSVIKV